MPRPTVLIASTNTWIARSVELLIENNCRELGLQLRCSEDEGGFKSAEDLFDFLERQDPAELADTLVLLDLGDMDLDSAFAPQATSMGRRWHWAANRTGVAAELLLRFPQVYPLFLSLYAPRLGNENTSSGAERSQVAPSGIEARSPTGDWREYYKLTNEIVLRHRVKGCNGESADCTQIHAFTTKLHFVSPLDGSSGLLSALRRFSSGMRCWFDPTGLRILVKNRMLGTLFGNCEDWSNTEEPRNLLLNRLDRVAIAVDEEREFASLNAYTAWKYGRRAWMVTTYADFAPPALWRSERATDVIILRDIDLRFPDFDPRQQADTRLSLTDIHNWDALRGDWTVRTITGEKNVVRPSRWTGWNWRLGQEGAGASRKYLGLQKPLVTIYELRAILGPWAQISEHSVIAQLGVANDMANTAANGSIASTHGAPYLNLAIAESLLGQARRCTKGGEGSLIGALLASESYELLLGMSKTTALEALLEMHRAEVRAEVSFPGVAHGLSIGDRIRDIEQSVETLYGRGAQSHSGLKRIFLSQFWADLRVIYREAERFDAAERANVESLIHSQWLRFISLPSAVKWLLLAPATSALGWTIAATLASGLFTLAYQHLGAWVDHPATGWRDWFFYWQEVVRTSLALQLTNSLEEAVKCASIRLKVVALAHLTLSYILFGLLISMLYRKITRA